jgi:glycosyltransferase involved in cell wall biosynthesis
MIIAINCRILSERPGGGHRYTVNLIKELSKIDQSNEYLLLLKKDYLPDFPLPDNFKKIIFPTKSKIIFDYWYIPRFSRKHNIDYFIFPKNTFSPFVRGNKIPIFHDIIYFEKDIKFREFKFFDHLHHKIMIRYAKIKSFLNFTVSEFTADRMKKLLKIPEKKIRIFKEAVESSFRVIDNKEMKEKLIKRLNLSFPFLFYSGSLSPRKNMLNVLRAFNSIKDKIPHNLYFTAGDSWKDNDISIYVQKHRLESRVIKLGFLSEEELILMYNIAGIYLYPSLYEGFGLPILEAQACGCPVITSNMSSCPEIAGDAAYLVDPRSVDQIAQAILSVASDEKLRAELIQKGFLNCQQYSWSKMAREFLEVFEQYQGQNHV